jgi:hypothetical protein
MRTQPNLIAKLLTASNFPAANLAAVVTIAAEASNVWCIRRITCSYADPANAATTPTAGRLTVVAGSTTLLDVAITLQGEKDFEFDQDNVLTNNTLNEAVVITLAAPGGAVVGKLAVQYQ